MPKNNVLRALLSLSCSLVFIVPAQAQYTIYDSQIEAARRWLIHAVIEVLPLGVGAPLLSTYLTYRALQITYSYHAAKIALSL